jgi:hypothetical protein
MRIRDVIIPPLMIAGGITIGISGCEINARLDRLQKQGVKVAGQVVNVSKTDHRRNGSHRYYSYKMEINFSDKEGGSHSGMIDVPEHEFHRVVSDGSRFKPGTPIDVVFDPNDTSNFRVWGDIDRGKQHFSIALAFILPVLGLVWGMHTAMQILPQRWLPPQYRRRALPPAVSATQPARSTWKYP